MSIVTGTIRARATVEAGSNPVVYNVSVTLANTEYSQVLTGGTKAFTIKNRESGPLKLSFSNGESGTVYVTIPPYCSLEQDGLNFSGSLYFQSTKPNQLVEIIEWT